MLEQLKNFQFVKFRQKKKTQGKTNECQSYTKVLL